MTPIHKYFLGEKLQCSVGIAIALVSIAVSLYFLLQLKTPFYKGMAYPLIIVSLFLLSVCIGIVVRTSKDIERVTHFVEVEKEKIKTDEIPRMEKVIKNFKVIKIVEICLLIVGVAMIFLAKENQFVRGIGLGLAIEAAIMLGFDVMAESRGKVYWDYLNGL